MAIPKTAKKAVKAVKAAVRAKAAPAKRVPAAKNALSRAVSVPKAKAAKRARISPADAEETFRRLHAHHADAHCELDHTSPFQLLIATVLSAQSTDVMVNSVTPELFRRWPTAAALAGAKTEEVEPVILKTGFFRQKTKSIVGLSQKLVAEHAGEVPRTLDALVKLPGVGRKTANVVLGVAFGTPEGVVVDTHVQRISQRLGFTRHTEPPEIEADLMRLFPKNDWDMLSHVLIFHGRRICTARKPACAACPVSDRCPSAFKAENVGRKGPRPPRP
jgi:endonuclease-3